MPRASRTEPPPREAESPAAQDAILVRGARVHNLKNIDLDIPRDRLVVFTGPSGSGKSSLAFDTLFAEGQRQYIESLSAYARQFLNQLERPDVDSISGLEATICIDQRPAGANPRSTVATVTEIYDYLRLLMARLGEPACHRCGTAIRPQSAEQIAARLLELAEGTKLMLLAPLVRGRKGEHLEVAARLRKAQIVRARIDGEIHDLDALPLLDARAPHHIEAVVDRLIVRPGVESRLADSLAITLKQGAGLVVACIQTETGWRDELFSTLYACPDCGLSFAEIEPRTFSFSSPYGACPTCEGLGKRLEFDPDLVLPDPSLSLDAGAIAPWKGSRDKTVRAHLAEALAFAAARGIDAARPIGELSAAELQQLLRGSEGAFAGLLVLLEKEFATATDEKRRAQLESFRGLVDCPACRGSRLRPEAASVRLAGLAIHEITRLSVEAARSYFAGLTFRAQDRPVADPIVSEIEKRLKFLEKVGVDYLALHRSTDTLSGGELQRVRLAAGIGSGLVGTCYVLDEPSIGLHPRDNERLIGALRELQELGNTVLVVEHDAGMMRAADWLVDFGPGAGARGGQVTAQGRPEDVAQDENSLTGRYLSGRDRIAAPPQRRKIARSRSISLAGASLHNLKQVSVQFPLGALVCVTGVSGSGKSSLVNETLARALARRLTGAGPKPGPHESLRGAAQIDKLVEIDQTPLGRTPRSNAATYSGAFDEIRKVFAATREAKQFGYRTSRFSFNVKSGRCEHCQGHGVKRIEMNFLPDLHVTCPECRGSRFNRQTLAVKYKGRSIAEVLELSVDEACEFFANVPAVWRTMHGLQEVGLGYLPIGQPATTLSGGEAQRVKLATELARPETGATLYILDEPTTGLHFDDIRRLLAVLARLIDRGNSVIVIEHNLDVMKTADWIIDLGPEGGAGGGRVLACGTPEEIAALSDNATGRALAPLLSPV